MMTAEPKLSKDEIMDKMVEASNLIFEKGKEHPTELAIIQGVGLCLVPKGWFEECDKIGDHDASARN